MASTHTRPQLSLLAQFDDYVRRFDQLMSTGTENEFVMLVKKLQVHQQKWKFNLDEYEKLQKELTKVKEGNCIAETKLKHMRSLVETESQKRQKVENEKRSLERQIAIIKEVLLSDQDALDDQTKEKLAFLRNYNTSNVVPKSSPHLLQTIEESMGSVLSSSDVSFDKTDDLDENEDGNLRCNITRRSRSKRSSYNFDEEGVSKKVKFQPEQNTNFLVVPEDPVKLRSQSGSTPLRRRSSAGRNHRNHEFITKTVIRPETCVPCGKKIKFSSSALKCQDCGLTCHPECKESVPQPCIPKMLTPTMQGALQGTIADYVPPASSPMVPALIFYCVKEIEQRGLNEIGLYHISGSERDVKDLKNKFLKGKSVPSLSKQNTSTLCSTVKEFLRSLHEPIVTRNLWRKFVDVLDETDSTNSFEELFKVIDLLPQANRDTLCFLLLHLNKIVNKQASKMSFEKVSSIFGPLIVGYPSAEPSAADMVAQKENQLKVMKLMLRVPSYHWEQFIGENVEDKCFVTPEPRPEPKGNLLGPLSGNGCNSAKSQGVVIGKTPLAPRGAKPGMVKTRRQFFSSPLLK